MSIARTIPLALAALSLASAAMAQGAPNATTFTVRVENISQGEALKLSTGRTAPFVSAPTFWVLHTSAGQSDLHRRPAGVGQRSRAAGRDGQPRGSAEVRLRRIRCRRRGCRGAAIGATADGPLTPGQAYEFEISATPGQSLSLAWMFGQSNDLFFSNERPIALFVGGQPVRGDVTTQISLWDAGTEVNEEPGLGPNQGPRQKSPDAGVREQQAVAHVRDEFTYPATAQVLRLSITPSEGALSSSALGHTHAAPTVTACTSTSS